MALHLGHRISRDLDFAVPDARLPREQVVAVLRQLQRDGGGAPEKVHYPAEDADFDDAGLRLDDYQQDFVVNGAKLSFFATGDSRAPALANDEPTRVDEVQLASIHSLVKLKALTLPDRNTQRDLFDIYAAIHSQAGVTPEIIGHAYAEAGAAHQLRWVLDNRLSRAGEGLTDPGYEPLGDWPPFEEVRQKLLDMRHLMAAPLALKPGRGLTNRPKP